MRYMEIAARCRQAAAIVAQGWTQGRLGYNKSSLSLDGNDIVLATHVCLWGGIYKACGGVSAHREIQSVLKVIGFHPSRLATWNDEPGRTQAEVVAKLHEIADAAELRAYAVGEVAEPPCVVIRKPVEQGELVTA